MHYIAMYFAENSEFTQVSSLVDLHIEVHDENLVDHV